MNDHKTSTPTLVSALRILAGEIQSDDGVANMTIAEAADRIEELAGEIERWRTATAKLRDASEEAGRVANEQASPAKHPDTELLEWLFGNTIIAGPDGHVIDCRDDVDAARKHGGTP